MKDNTRTLRRQREKLFTPTAKVLR